MAYSLRFGLTAVRSYSTAGARSLVFKSFGLPNKVLSLETGTVPSAGTSQALVRMIAAPIGPVDIDGVVGAGPQAASFPKVGGNEGVGVVESVGKGSSLKVGDWVIPARAGLGTWRSHLVVSDDDVHVVSSKMEPEYAATLGGAPCTALRLLNDFVSLKEGDVIIQNGANSQVGQTIVQLANMRGIKTINLIRSRDDDEQANTVERIKAYGGYLVVTDEYARTHQFSELISDLPRPKLALNGAGGVSATDIARTLAPGGTFVTYGNSSRAHLQLPSSLFLFNNITARGFNLAQWAATHSKAERDAMVKEVSSLVEKKKLRFWLETHRLSDWDVALERATKRQLNRKVVLHLDK